VTVGVASVSLVMIRDPRKWAGCRPSRSFPPISSKSMSS